MAKNKHSRKLRIATLFLTFVMILAFCAFFLAACATTTEENEEEDTSVKKKDTKTFKNGNFEYFDDNSESYLISTPESWTSSTGSNSSGVSASSSVAKSGIVDTSIDWSTFVDAYNDYEYYSDLDDNDPALEDAKYYKDIDNNYDIPGWDIADAAKGEDEDAASDDAVKTAAKALNPGTHWGDDVGDNGTHVLMLHNYRSNKMGTAAKYTSTSITLAAGTAAKFSVWVKTSNLTYNDGTAVDGNRGAYIEVSNTVGGQTQDSLVVRNINTDEWEQYTFYVKASSYATTTFSVILGLGMQAESTSTNYYEYVQGYAFFDDLTYEVMTADEFDDNLTTNVTVSQQRTKLDLSFGSDAWKFDAAELTDNSFSLDLDTVQFAALDISGAVVDDTKDNANRYENTYIEYFKDKFNSAELKAQQDQIKKDKELSKVVNKSNIDSGDYTAAFKKDFEKFNDLSFGGADENILVLYSGKGAPYTATLTSGEFSVAKDSYKIISFWVKTSDLQGGTGAQITLIDADNETSIAAFDTTTLTGTDLVDDQKKDKEEYQDINDGWQQCFFYLTNDTDEPRTFSLEFSYGPTSISGSTLSSFTPGYAAFTGFETATVESEEYSLKTTGTYAVEVALKGSEFVSESVFDDVSYAYPDAIKTGFADPRNYSGIYGNTTYVGGETVGDTDRLATAGLLNREYAADYATSLSEALTNCPSLVDAIANWDTVFGKDCTQPLLIANTVESYGFYSNSTASISASSYSIVTVRVMLSAKTTANVYLIDTADPEFGDKQYVSPIEYTSGVSYRYDENGNVVNKDPEADDYSAKTNTLFYKQDNGLWFTAKDFTGDTYYANLANYERDAETGDLLDASGNVVYYATEEDGVYYRYKDADTDALSVKVKDFADAGVDLTGAVRQQAKTKVLSQEIVNDKDTTSDWYYVRFFIATGDEAKNYRLEVWSGDRKGETTNPADSFVAFDVVEYSELTEDKFNEQVNSRLDKLAADLRYDDADALKKAYDADPDSFADKTDGKELILFHFSLFDDNSYTSYDADYSDAEVDPYSDYNADDYSTEVAYLRYNNASAADGRVYYDTFVNYAASEIAVTTTTEEEEETEDTTTTPTDQNVWLLVVSIVLAVVLIFTMLALLLRKLLANVRVKGPRSNRKGPSYDNKRKRYIRKLRLEEAEHDDSADDVLPDEDEISEEDIYKVDLPEESEISEAESESDDKEKDGSDNSDGSDNGENA